MTLASWLKTRWQRTEEKANPPKPKVDSPELVAAHQRLSEYLNRSKSEQREVDRRTARRGQLARTRSKRRRKRLQEKAARKLHRESAGPRGKG